MLCFSFAPEKSSEHDLILWAEGVPGAKMHGRMSVQYGNSVTSQQIVYKWTEGSRMVTQALRMRKEPDAHPHLLLMQIQDKSMK